MLHPWLAGQWIVLHREVFAVARQQLLITVHVKASLVGRRVGTQTDLMLVRAQVRVPEAGLAVSEYDRPQLVDKRRRLDRCRCARRQHMPTQLETRCASAL